MYIVEIEILLFALLSNGDQAGVSSLAAELANTGFCSREGGGLVTA